MNISFENPDKINGLLTIVVEESDYKADVEKTLKDYRKRANVPGFRPGQVPMGMVKRQYGTAVKVDVVNKFAQVALEHITLGRIVLFGFYIMASAVGKHIYLLVDELVVHLDVIIVYLVFT